jgi:hypothetical protein
VGTMLIVAAASIWLGAELTRRIEWAVPYAGGLGVVLMVAGVARELWAAKGAPPADPRH